MKKKLNGRLCSVFNLVPDLPSPNQGGSWVQRPQKMFTIATPGIHMYTEVLNESDSIYVDNTKVLGYAIVNT